MHMDEQKPIFVVDCMLGRLAKWLRIFGFDVVYFRSIQDEKLMGISKAPGHILLTRDTGVIKRSDIGPYLLITSDFLREQLSQVFESLDLCVHSDTFLTRCLSCNQPLEPVGCEHAQGRVPDFVFLSYRRFSRCTGCGKFFWAGTHQREMQKMMQRLFVR